MTASRQPRILLYTTDMELTSDALEQGDLRRAAELLERHAGPEDEDLRGFEWHYYHKRANIIADVELPIGRWVDDVEVSPDGRWLAVTGPEGTVIVFDTKTWNRFQTMVAVWHSATPAN